MRCWLSRQLFLCNPPSICTIAREGDDKESVPFESVLRLGRSSDSYQIKDFSRNNKTNSSKAAKPTLNQPRFTRKRSGNSNFPFHPNDPPSVLESLTFRPRDRNRPSTQPSQIRRPSCLHPVRPPPVPGQYPIKAKPNPNNNPPMILEPSRVGLM